MLKVIRVIQIIFSIIGLIITVYSFGFGLMVSVSALSSSYSEQSLGAYLFLACFGIAFLSFAISIFKPVALCGLFIIPLVTPFAISLEAQTYNITPKYEDDLTHFRIGHDLIVRNDAYLVSKIPKKRMRNYPFLCKHDYELIRQQNREYFKAPPKAYWEKELKMDYFEPQFEEVSPDTRFKIVGAFKCDKVEFLSVQDGKGRLIEVMEASVKRYSNTEDEFSY